VIDSASVDGRRRLIIVRRDNVEHLLMIGGPSDVVVEQNIVRGMPAGRDLAARVLSGGDAQPRLATTPDNTTWHAQPSFEPAPRPSLDAAPPRQPRLGAKDDAASWPADASIDPRGQRGIGALAGLADELAARAAPVRDLDSSGARMRIGAELSAADATESLRFEPARDDADRAEPQRTLPRSESRESARVEAPRESMALRTESMREPTRAEPMALRPESIREPARAPALAATNDAPATLPEAADKDLATMAHRLEAALRRPGAPNESRQPNGAAAPAPAQARVTVLGADTAETPAVRARKPAEPTPATDAKPARSESKPKSLYDSIEQEMASLLGRPAGKS
jgi:flagellar protein FliO/FliZ